MARIEVLPHHTAPPSAWQRAGWTVALDDEPPQPVPPLLPGWDYDRTLVFRTETTVDVNRLHESCRTGGSGSFELVCIWDCPAAGVRGVGSRHLLIGQGNMTLGSIFRIPPRILAERVRVERQVVLAEVPESRNSPFVPGIPGSVILWEREDQVVSMALEGSGGRFPVEAIDFAQAGLPNAAWQLSVTYDDPNDAFLGSVRLYVNSSHPAIAELLQEPDSPSARRTLSVIQWDASRRLILQAAEDDRMSQPMFEEGSVGDVIQGICKSILQRHDIRALVGLIKKDPERFETLLQDKLRLLHSE